MREDVIRAHAELASVCEHIHLPLQSGSSRILKAMRRTYDRERYLGPCGADREHLPDVSLSTDVIVASPARARRTSSRPGCRRRGRLRQRVHLRVLAAAGKPAADITDGVVAHPVKIERMGRLLEVRPGPRPRARTAFVGREVEVLVEGPSRNDPDPPARPHATQQGRELHRARRAG